VGTYSAWESTATSRLLGGARGAWAPTGEGEGRGTLCRHAHSLYETRCTCSCYPAVALAVDSTTTAVELRVVAVAVVVVSVDVVTRAAAVHRIPMWITRALLQIVSSGAVPLRAVVAATIREVTADGAAACGSVVQRRVVLVAFVVNEVLAVPCRIVAAVHSAMTARL